MTAAELQDEQYEGTRVRVDNATVLTAPDADGYWTVGLEDGEVTCWGVDTYDPIGNEDPDGPTPGDVYQIFGASHQNGDSYVLHVCDIDVLSLGVGEASADAMAVYPNPVADRLFIRPGSSVNWDASVVIGIYNVQGRMVREFAISSAFNGVDVSSLTSGVCFMQMQGESGEGIERCGKFAKR